MFEEHGFLIRKVRQTDIRKIIEVSEPYYTNYGHPLFPCDESSLRDIFNTLLRTSKFFYCAEFNGTLVAWMAANEKSPHPYSPVTCLNQSFYHTTLQGRKAIELFKVMHDWLFEFAEHREYETVFSSSVLPNKQIFYRLLTSIGWSETPTGAVRQTRHHRNG